jgi:hypothetical protein
MKTMLHFRVPVLNRMMHVQHGRWVLRSGLAVQVREPAPAPLPAPLPAPPADPGSPQSSPVPARAVLDFIASNETLDRYREVIVASGWRLENYRRNPVFQNAHQYGDILFTLGKALITEVRGTQLFQRIEFATEANPMARIAYALYRGGFLNAVSVGFIPLRWIGPDGQEYPVAGGAKGQGGRTARAAFGRGTRYLEQELLEVSAVAIPANPDALQLAVRAGALSRSDLEATSDLLRVNLSSAARERRGKPSKAAGAVSSDPWREALRLAQQLNHLLKPHRAFSRR